VPVGCLSRHQNTGGGYFKVRYPGQERISYIALVAPGKRHATKNKTLAVEIARRAIKRQGAEVQAAPPNITRWADAFQRALRHHAGELYTKNVAGALRRFAKAMDVHRVRDITPQAIQQYLNGLDRAPKTKINHVNAISPFCNRLARQHDDGGDPLLANNPCRHVEGPKVHHPPPVALEDDGRAELLARAEGAGIYSEVLAALHTGLRLGGLRALRWQDIRKGPTG